SFSDEDLGGRFAGAKRFRSRFENISLNVGKGREAIDQFLRVDTDIAGAASALQALSGKVTPAGEPFYKVARARLDDGKEKVELAKVQLQALAQAHAAYAGELDHDLSGLDPDQVFAKALQRNGRSVIGVVALTPADLTAFTPAEIEENVARIERVAIQRPVFAWEEQPGVQREKVVEKNQAKRYAGLRAP